MSRGGFQHKVVKGDSLWRIAKNAYGHGAYWSLIAKANPGKVGEGGLIIVGTEMHVPLLLANVVVGALEHVDEGTQSLPRSTTNEEMLKKVKETLP